MAIMQLLLLLEEHYAVAIPVGSVSRANFKSAQTVSALLVQQGFAISEGIAEEPSPSTVSSEPEKRASKPVVAIPEAKFDRLPLRDCDFLLMPSMKCSAMLDRCLHE